MKARFQIFLIATSFLTGCTNSPHVNESNSRDWPAVAAGPVDVNTVRPLLSKLRKGMTKQQVFQILGLWDKGPDSGSSGFESYSYHLSNGQLLSLGFSSFNTAGSLDAQLIDAEIHTPIPIDKDTEPSNSSDEE